MKIVRDILTIENFYKVVFSGIIKMTTQTLEKKSEEREVPMGFVRCEFGNGSCGKVVREQDAHYLPTPTCPECYDRWFYSQED